MKITVFQKRIVASLVVLFAFGLPLLVGAQWNPTSGSEGSGLETNKTFSDILNDVLLWGLGILAVLSAIAFLVSGIMWILSGGGDNAKTARGWLTGSIIGLVVALLGYIIIITIDAIISS